MRRMCRVLAVSVSRYYAYRQRPERWRAVIDEVLMAHVRIAFAESVETYGAPRVHQALRAARLPTSTQRVARLMREAGGRLARKRAVGWAMRDTMEVDLVLSALRAARAARQPAPGVIFQSDRGSPNASAAHRTERAAHGMLASMRGKGDCYEHTVA